LIPKCLVAKKSVFNPKYRGKMSSLYIWKHAILSQPNP
jgi:hypothetical protein